MGEESTGENAADGGRQADADGQAAAASKPDEGKPRASGREITCNVFTVELTRPSRDIPFGVVFDRADRRILEIIAVDSATPNSVAAAYNKTVDPSRQLLPGRFVM